MVAVRLLTCNPKGVITNISKAGKKYPEIANDAMSKIHINDSTLRVYEIFNPFKNFDASVENLGYDELNFQKFLDLNERQKTTDIVRKYFDTNITCAKIIGTDRTVFQESLLNNPTPANKMMLKFTNWYSFKDVANIFFRANGFHNEKYIKDCFKLLDKYPLKQVLKAMPDGILNAKTSKEYDKELLYFIVDNPGKRNLVVTKNIDGVEIFDEVTAKNYNSIKALCKNNDEINAVIKACKYTNINGFSLGNNKLYSFAIDILTKNKTWTNADTKLFKKLKGFSQNQEVVNNSLLNKFRELFNNGSLNSTINNFDKKSHDEIKNTNSAKLFDEVTERNYKTIEALCNNKDELNTVIEACKYKTADGFSLGNEKLYNLAIDILTKNKTWTDNDTKLFSKFKCFVDNEEYVDEYLVSDTSRLLNKGIFSSVEELLRRHFQ